MAKGENQKLKMLYLVKIFTKYTDDQHSLTMQEIIKKLASYDVSADRKTLYLVLRSWSISGWISLRKRSGAIRTIILAKASLNCRS